MENRRTIIFLFSLCVVLTPSWLFAYEPNSTHDALTHEAVNFYNMFSRGYGTPMLTERERTLIQQGAMEEDDDYRMAHHFYDPVHNKGLKMYMSSKVWAQSPTYQGSWRNGPGGCLIRPHTFFPLYESPCDYSWQRAIYDYTYGDKERAMKALGHTLHLIEDASVPDHTRNDAHIPIFDPAIAQFDENFSQKSPFEEFTDQFSLANKNVTTTQQLFAERAVPYKIFTLDGYFDNTAKYSNSNFFSKSTIFDTGYSLPIIQSTTTLKIENVNVVLGNYADHGLVHIITEQDKVTLIDTYSYNLITPSDYLLKDYWQLTSRDAVKNAAGVIRLFFEEVEKEKQTHALRNEKDPLIKQAAVKSVRGVVLGIKGVGIAGKFASLGVTYSLLGVKFIGEYGRDGVILALEKGLGKPAQNLAHIAPVTPISPSIQSPIVTSVPPMNTTQQISKTPINLTDLMRKLIDAQKTLEQLTATPQGESLALKDLTLGDVGEVAGAATVLENYVYVPHANSMSFSGGDRGGVVIFLTDSSASSPAPIPEATTTETTITPIDVTAPDAPNMLKIVSQEDNLDSPHLATTSAIISGTAEANAVVALSWLADAATIIIKTTSHNDG